MATDLLDCKSAAEYLSVRPSTLRRWTFARKITFIRVGARAVRFRRSDLDKLIRQGERPALRPVGALEDPGAGNGGE